MLFLVELYHWYEKVFPPTDQEELLEQTCEDEKSDIMVAKQM